MKKRRSAGQIVSLLPQANDLWQGMNVPDACRRLGISQQTFERLWVAVTAGLTPQGADRRPCQWAAGVACDWRYLIRSTTSASGRLASSPSGISEVLTISLDSISATEIVTGSGWFATRSLS